MLSISGLDTIPMLIREDVISSAVYSLIYVSVGSLPRISNNVIALSKASGMISAAITRTIQKEPSAPQVANGSVSTVLLPSSFLPYMVLSRKQRRRNGFGIIYSLTKEQNTNRRKPNVVHK